MNCCGSGCCMSVPIATPYVPPDCCCCVPGVPPATAAMNCCNPCDGCPRGYKPCTMCLTPPVSRDPRGIWLATVEPCPPGDKAKKACGSSPCCAGPCGPCFIGKPCKYRANGLDCCS